MRRVFVESKGYSRDREALEKAGELAEADLMALERDIAANPETGSLVMGTGGLRKIRLGQSAVGRGKRGGVRVWYLDLPDRERTYLVALYGKREKDNLSAREKAVLRGVVDLIKEKTK